jgi:hypothetical protein
MPHRIMLVPLAIIYAFLTAVCGLQSTGIVLAAAAVFAVLAYAFVPDRLPRHAGRIVGSHTPTEQGD